MSIIFLERHDNEKRKNGWRAAGETLSRRAQRPCPFDFAEVAKKLEYGRNAVSAHYSAGLKTIDRWSKETGLTLRRGKLTVIKPREEREFDPTRDGHLLRMAVRAMTGRAEE